MTAPTPGSASGFKIAQGYVAVGLKDDTAGDATRIKAAMYQRLPGKHVIPVEAKLTSSTGPELDRLRNTLYELKKSARITPTYEARQVMDAMGNYQTRYFKVSADTGKFIGEVMSSHMMKSFATLIRLPALFGPILTGAAALAGSAAFLAIPAAFLKIGATAQLGSGQAKSALDRLKLSIDEALLRDSAVLAGPLISAMGRVENATGRLSPQFQMVFGSLPRYVEAGTSSLLRIADSVMPNVTLAALRAGPAIQGVFDGSERASQGVSSFLSRIMNDGPAAGQVFRTIGTLAGGAGDMIGRITSGVIQLFGSQIWASTEAVFGRLFIIIGNIAHNALPGLGAGLNVALQFMNGILTVIQPISALMGSWLGTVLGVTIAIRGFSSAIGVMSAVMALLKFTPVTSALNTLAMQFGNTGVAAAGYVTKITGSAEAGERVASMSNRVVGGLKAVGGALPVVGALLIAGSFAWDAYQKNVEEADLALVTGSRNVQLAVSQRASAIQVASQMQQNENMVIGQGISMQEADAQARREMNDTIRETTARLGPLGVAQETTKARQREYNLAVADYGPTSDQAKAAQERFAAATRDEERATLDAKRAVQDHTQALIEHQNQIMGQANADLAHRMALHDLKKAENDAAEAIRDHGRGSDEYKDAAFRVEGAQLRVVESTGRLASENAGATTETDKNKRASDAQRESLLNMATSIENRGNPQLRAMTDKLSDTEIQANNTAVQVSGFHYEVRMLPDGRQVYISTPGLAQAKDEVIKFHDEIRRINGKDVKINLITTSLGSGGIASAGRLASGGPVIGPGTGTSDTAGLYALSHGEHVWTAREVDAAGGHGAMNVMRKEVIRQGRGRAAGGGIERSPNDLRIIGTSSYIGSRPGAAVNKVASAMFNSGAYSGPVGGKGVTRWSGVVLQALRMMNQPASLLSTVLRRMNQESGGNPGIVNRWDVNAKRGTPSGGLMQTIGPTFRAYHYPGTSWNMFDPLANVLASMRYAMARYGSLPRAYNKRGGYDSGGLADGAGFISKGPAPERVLSPDQTKAFERAMDHNFSGGGGSTVINVSISGRELQDLKGIDHFTDMVKKAARQGPRTTAGVR